MVYGPGGGVLTALLHVVGTVFSLVVGAVAFVIVLALIALLVRFLWFGTRAAQLYLEKNGESSRFTWPVSPIGRRADAASAPTAPSPADAPGSGSADDLTATRPYETSEATATDAPPAPKSPRKPKSPPSSS